MKRLWTLLRFCSFGCFFPVIECSRQSVPGLYLSPYITRSSKEGGVQLSLQFNPDGTFSVLQVRPQSFYEKKYPDKIDSTEVREDRCWAKIPFHWTISGTSPSSEKTPVRKQPIKAILEYPHVEFNPNTSDEIINYVLDSLTGQKIEPRTRGDSLTDQKDSPRKIGNG